MAEGVVPPPPWESKSVGIPPPPWESASTFDKMSVSERASKRLESIKSGPAKEQYDSAIRSADKDIATRRARVAKDAILAGGAALAAPATAGMSLVGAAAVMAAAGASASLVAEGVKAVMGSDETAKNIKDLAWTTGFDAATFAVSEAGGRAIGAFAKKVLPSMVMRSASKVARGEEALKNMSERTIYGLEGRLQASVGVSRETLDTDIAPLMRRAEARLAELPVGKGEFGEQFASKTSATEEVLGKMKAGLKAKADTPVLERQLRSAASRAEKAGEEVASRPQFGYDAAKRLKVKRDADALVSDIAKRLDAARGADSTKQPLDVLITIKGNVQQFAYEHSAYREGKVFKQMAQELDSTIRSQLKGDELTLYDHYNSIMRAKFDRTKALEFSNRYVNFFAKRMLGSAVGGGIGYEAGGIKGAVAGAAIGAATPTASAFILEKTLMHPKSALLLKKAVNTWIEGSEGEANLLARRAFVTAGVRSYIGDAIRAAQSASEAGQ